AASAGPVSNQLIISGATWGRSQTVPLSATGVSSLAELVWVDANGAAIGESTEVIFTNRGPTSGIVRLRNVGSSPADITQLQWSPVTGLFSYSGIADGSQIAPAQIVPVTIRLTQRNIGSSTLTIQAKGNDRNNTSVEVRVDSIIIRPPGPPR